MLVSTQTRQTGTGTNRQIHTHAYTNLALAGSFSFTFLLFLFSLDFLLKLVGLGLLGSKALEERGSALGANLRHINRVSNLRQAFCLQLAT